MIRFLLLLALPLQALALSPAAQEFISISKELEPVQCEKRRLRRQMALAEVERRDADEVAVVAGHRVAPDGVAVENRAFDVTPADLVTGYVTEDGVA